MVLEQTLYPSWSSIFDSFYEFHWIYKAKEWQFTTFLAKDEKFCLDAFTVSLYNRGSSIILIEKVSIGLKAGHGQPKNNNITRSIVAILLGESKYSWNKYPI